MFEQETGIDSFTKHGADANAATSFFTLLIYLLVQLTS